MNAILARLGGWKHVAPAAILILLVIGIMFDCGGRY